MTTATEIKSKARFFTEPKGIAITIALVLVFWIIMQWNLSGAVFLAIAILFLVGFRQPLWAMAAILASQMTISSYRIATPVADISLRLILLLLTLVILRGAWARGEVNLGTQAKKLIIPVFLFIGLTIIANIVNGVDFDTAFKGFRNMFVGLLFIILLPAIINNHRQLKILCGFMAVIVIGSAIIGIMQHYNFLGLNQATIIPEFLTGTNRVTGFSETELEIAYIFPVMLMVLVSLYFSHAVGPNRVIYLFLPMLPILGATYFTYTRSALFALISGLISLFFFFRTRIRWEIILLVMAAFILIIESTHVLEGTYLRGRSEDVQESSSVARDILWQAGIAIALDNPVFGIGLGRFRQISPTYAQSVDPTLIEWENNRYFTFTTLGSDDPHNDFIDIWVTYGSFSLLVFIVLHVIVIRNFMYSFVNSKNRFVKGISIGFAAALVTYVTNSFYHNLLFTLPLLWILAGFSLVTAKLASKENQTLELTKVEK